MTLTLRERFWAKVVISDACWEWSGFVSANGYGRFSKNLRAGLAHRASYELNIGPIPDGLCVLHRCDNRRCVRPDHLFLGTFADNVADMDAKGRSRRTGRKGERHHQAKLSASAIISIRQQCAAGRPGVDLAAEFGVTNAQISRIRLGKSWGHVR